MLSSKDLDEWVLPPVRDERNYETHSLYMCLFEYRDKLLKYLIENGIEAKIHYPIPLHLQEASKIYGYKIGDFSKAEIQADKLITLPIHQYVDREQIEYMVNTIKNFYLNGESN